jgi:mRNA interferase MazF
MYFKDFDNWNAVKKRIQAEDRTVHIRKGEIRWVSLGVNIGSEMDGKGVSFARPALIIHVIGSRLALVVPVTSKTKEFPGYVPFAWKDKANALCIHQMRIVSQKRILHRLGRISTNRLREYALKISDFYSLPPGTN